MVTVEGRQPGRTVSEQKAWRAMGHWGMAQWLSTRDHVGVVSRAFGRCGDRVPLV